MFICDKQRKPFKYGENETPAGGSCDESVQRLGETYSPIATYC